jgi:hypothetical protein
MGWSCGFDSNWGRDVGYGVPATCDQPGCGAVIDRGLGYVCGGDVYGGEHGCGLYFCEEHNWHGTDGPYQRCERCAAGLQPFEPTPDVLEWINHKLTDESWARWRTDYPEVVERYRKELVAQGADPS